MVAAALLAVVPEVTCAATLGSSNNNIAFVSRSLNVQHHEQQAQQPWEVLRGGATMVDDEYDEDEYDEYDSESEEEEEVVVVKKKKTSLAKSAVKASTKAKVKKTAASKKVVNSAISKKKTSTSILKKLHVPYIIRACLNPFMFAAMTKGYFASLFNLNYMKEDESQGLRSALEEKAKKAAAAGGGAAKKGKRTMRPGQAKTLSDLPQLNT